jgi:PKD repeat protein
VTSVTNNTLNSAPVSLTLPATDPNGNALTFRIVSQSTHGSTGVSNNIATYFPDPGFVGTDTFTFAANDTYADSNLGTGTVAVAQGPFSLGATAHVPPNYPAAWPVAFGVVSVVTNTAAPVTFVWNFGDGAAADTNQFAQHTYDVPGSYQWRVVASVAGASVTNMGIINIGNAVELGVTAGDEAVLLSWPATIADTLLEEADVLAPNSNWVAATNSVSFAQNRLTVTVPLAGNKFFRIRRPW